MKKSEWCRKKQGFGAIGYGRWVMGNGYIAEVEQHAMCSQLSRTAAPDGNACMCGALKSKAKSACGRRVGAPAAAFASPTDGGSSLRLAVAATAAAGTLAGRLPDQPRTA